MNYLVVGLGNIGAEYASTRHNMGFMVLDAWAQASSLVFESRRYGSIAECSFKGRKFILLKPSTYMNLSGNAVRYWVNKLDLPLDNLVVICDDLNLPFGTVRMKKRGSSGGHNGLENIEALLGTDEYCRIRIGIGNDFNRGGQVDYVLSSFSEEETAGIPSICERIIKGIRMFSVMGAERAMNELNIKASNEEK
jgi:PTH1 family peptidyl-tRNA hydrolase